MNADVVRSASTDMNSNVEGYFCTNCGSKLVLNEKEPVVYCESCHKAYVSTNFYGLEKYVARAKILEKDAWDRVNQWFKEGGARDLATSAELASVKTMYLPFWKTKTETRTVVCGYNVYKDNKGNQRYEFLKRMYKKNYVWDDIACDGSEYGVQTYDISVPVVPLFEIQEQISLVPVTISESDAKKASTDAVIDTAQDDAGAGISNVTFLRIFPKLKDFKLIYLPYVVVRYKYHGREYSVVLNGRTGNVDAGTKPGDKGQQATNFSICFGIGSTLIGAGIGILAAELITMIWWYSMLDDYLLFLLMSDSQLLLGFILTAVMAVILIWIGRSLHKKSLHILQYGSEITTGNQKTESKTSSEVR
ncbi:hypothetical protein [Methanorbis furvi]|uniref:Uncharacterized protein n=1 Tax=Methanorbis furvi TaxID=3028299 RepID=A0AAE4MCI8_9EURY|nr:hypothetical protein [Methanocorpusculaceae archaeon Ag1]